TDNDRARTLVEEAEKTELKPQIAMASDSQVALVLNQSFDRAWRRDGVAIDSAGFSVEDRDRSAGDYYVRYLDTDTGRKLSQPGLIDRMFGRKSTTQADNLRIHVAEHGSNSSVMVLNEAGQ